MTAKSSISDTHRCPEGHLAETMTASIVGVVIGYRDGPRSATPLAYSQFP
jgi:hypothetical protein